jgi:hypothetical protein
MPSSIARVTVAVRSVRSPPSGRQRAGGDHRRRIWACGGCLATAILSGMSTESRIPAQPTLAGLEDKWTQRWAKERVVQV